MDDMGVGENRKALGKAHGDMKETLMVRRPAMFVDPGEKCKARIEAFKGPYRQR